MGLVGGLSLMAFGLNSINEPVKKANQEDGQCGESPLNPTRNFIEVKEVNLNGAEVKVGSRFIWKISESDLHNATSIRDIFPKDVTKGIRNFDQVRLEQMGDLEISEMGEGERLNQAQLSLIQKMKNGNEFNLKAYYKTVSESSGKSQYDHLIYYFSIVPDQEAVYNSGMEQLEYHLKSVAQKEILRVDRKKWEPGRLSFTISKDGEVTDVNLESTSGFNNVDTKFMEAIMSLPLKWTPAKNHQGEAVEQELILFFGTMGC